MDFVHLPTLNALLNTTSALFLTLGFVFIKRGNIAAHKLCMSAAFTISVLFLISYLYYHVQYGATRFQGTGWIRPVYFSILISHTILAVLVAPMALITLVQALRGTFDKHRRIARWTWPLWMYVSLTGVIVYLLLYRF